MGVQVGFDYGAWSARYPEFSTTVTSAAQAQGFFNEATVYHANDGSGPVCNVVLQSTFLNMLTAHIAALAVGTNKTQPTPTLVGRISNASEGSVSVATQNDYPPGSAQWFEQTQYGAAYWAATRGYRTFRYRPNPQRIPSAIFPSFRG